MDGHGEWEGESSTSSTGRCLKLSGGVEIENNRVRERQRGWRDMKSGRERVLFHHVRTGGV
jgi:hypothetical protein